MHRLPLSFSQPLRAVLLCAGLCAGLAASAAGPTVYIDPSATANGDGSLASPFNTWANIAFVEGGTYLQKSGTTSTQTITVTAQGTAANPIALGAYGSGNAPRLNAGSSGGIVLSGAAYVQISGLEISSPDAGVKIVNGAHHATVQNNTFVNCGIGVWLGTGPGKAGDAHLIDANIMHGMGFYGVAAAIGVNARPGTETVISNNTIYDCQYHGIEISGDHYIVERNRIYDIGKIPSGGCSGVHLFSGINGGFPGAQVVQHNIIRYNLCANAHDAVAQDGNGIQLDQHCDNNEVYQNFCFYNDGQGIIAYDAAGNSIHHNITFGNGRNPGNTHLVKSEIALFESDQEHNVHDNTVANNLALATSASTQAIVFRTFSGGLRGNLIGNNFFQNTAGGSVYAWMLNTLGSDAATWNGTYAVGGGDDQFTNIPLVSDAQVTAFDYKFGVDEPRYNPPAFTIDGVSRTIAGWRATNGQQSSLIYAAAGGGEAPPPGGGGTPPPSGGGGGTPPPSTGGGGGGGGAPSPFFLAALLALLAFRARRLPPGATPL